MFNAGRGATLNLIGQVEADTGIMDGSSHRGAGVALLRRVKNPISLARIVLDKTDHALLAGGYEERLAEIFNLPKVSLKDPAWVRQWKQATRKLGKHDLSRFPRNLRLIQRRGRDFLGDTVGAVAIDRNGDLAAGGSSGGVFLKLPGRIGDSPILGAGLYADNSTGAATATGLGEIAMRLVVSKTSCDAMGISECTTCGRANGQQCDKGCREGIRDHSIWIARAGLQSPTIPNIIAGPPTIAVPALCPEFANNLLRQLSGRSLMISLMFFWEDF